MSNEPYKPEHQNFLDMLNYIEDLVSSDNIIYSTAKGLIYSVVETLGTLVGDSDLPEHVISGYQGTLELARELQIKLESMEK